MLRSLSTIIVISITCFIHVVHNTNILIFQLQVSHKTKFLDRIRVYVKGGTGGQGYPKYGGLGGDGGNVYFVAGESENLYEFANEYPKKRFLAGKGSDSK